jgi:DNA-binding NarL/FixJ family response regulator
MARVRTQIVEDFVGFQRFIRSTIETIPGIEVVEVTADGKEAVRRAEALQPDLVLMDVGLPSMSGIEAARKIREVSAKSKLLFVTQETSKHLAQEIFNLGALGYVVKEHAGSELVPAVEAVCQGQKFVSKGLLEKGYGEPDPETRVGAVDTPGELATRQHVMQFFADDESFREGMTNFIFSALDAGNSVIVVATEAHRESFLGNLEARGVDTESAIEQGRYLTFDVYDTLSAFMDDGRPNAARFMKVAGDLVAKADAAAKGSHPRVAVCCECAPTMWLRGTADAAVEIEHLWDELSKVCSVDLLCGYIVKDSEREQENLIYARICAEHSSVCCA